MWSFLRLNHLFAELQGGIWGQVTLLWPRNHSNHNFPLKYYQNIQISLVSWNHWEYVTFGPKKNRSSPDFLLECSKTVWFLGNSTWVGKCNFWTKKEPVEIKFPSEKLRKHAGHLGNSKWLQYLIFRPQKCRSNPNSTLRFSKKMFDSLETPHDWERLIFGPHEYRSNADFPLNCSEVIQDTLKTWNDRRNLISGPKKSRSSPSFPPECCKKCRIFQKTKWFW